MKEHFIRIETNKVVCCYSCVMRRHSKVKKDFKIIANKVDNNKIDEWKIYSSHSNKVIAKFDSEKELKVYLVAEVKYEGRLKEIIEELLNYPNEEYKNELVYQKYLEKKI